MGIVRTRQDLSGSSRNSRVTLISFVPLVPLGDAEIKDDRGIRARDRDSGGRPSRKVGNRWSTEASSVTVVPINAPWPLNPLDTLQALWALAASRTVGPLLGNMDPLARVSVDIPDVDP